jgi:uncharacterized protein YdaU (DUF1376 family)
VSKKSDIWMPIYIGDYLADTGHLTTTQHGAYLLLMMHYWRKSELPADDKQLAAIAKLPLRIWLDMKETLQAFFHDGWKHKRIEAEIQRRRQVSSKRAEAGAKGGAKPRKDIEPEGSNCSDFASDLLKQNESMTQSQSFAVAGDAREPSTGNLVTPEAMQLTERLLVIAGHDPNFWPPGWMGAPMRVQTWLSQGWQPEVIVAAVKSSAARKRGPPANSIQFFENAIAEEAARQAAPLPTVEIRQPENLTVSHAAHRDRSANSLTASIRRELDELERTEGADPALPSGTVHLLPARSVR